MNGKQSHSGLSRREFLKLLAATGITAVGGYVLFEYTPWLDYEEQASFIRRPLARVSTLPAQMLELVRYATLAANGHNTQPWQFAVKENAIEIRPDYNQPVEVAELRSQFQSALGIGAARPQLLVRFGYADAMPRSLRRPVEQVVVQS